MKVIRGCFVFAGLVILTSPFVFSQTQPERVLVSSDSHIVSYVLEGRYVVITMEATRDFTDDFRGTFPKVDFMGFDVDADNDGNITPSVDFAYGVRSGSISICSQYLITEIASTGCHAGPTKGHVEMSFRSTTAEERPHPVMRFVIPTSELFPAKDPIRVRFKFYNSGLGYTYLPAKERGESYHSFDETIKFDPFSK